MFINDISNIKIKSYCTPALSRVNVPISNSTGPFGLGGGLGAGGSVDSVCGAFFHKPEMPALTDFIPDLKELDMLPSISILFEMYIITLHIG